MKLVIVLSAFVAVALATPTAVYKAANNSAIPYSNSTDSDDTLRIFGGSNANRNQFPYIVSVQIRTGSSYKHFCGGSILARNWILTAAHCTQLDAFSFRVVAGIILLNQSDHQIVYPVQIINHPLYLGGRFQNDISLIRLGDDLHYGANVRPISIPPQGRRYTGEATTSGWGFTRYGEPSPNHLQFVDVRIVPEEECKTIWNFFSKGHTVLSIELNICSELDTKDQSTCSGDSGGPLVQNGLVIGVLSGGLKYCGIWRIPSIYGKTSAFTQWIVETTHGDVKPSDY